MATEDYGERLARLEEQAKSQMSLLTLTRDEMRDGFMLLDHKLFGNAREGYFQSYSRRLNILEHWRWYLSGAIAITGFMLLLFIAHR